jgi:hypothetical protein
MNMVVLEPEIQISTLMRVDTRNLTDVITAFCFAGVVITLIFILVYAGVPEKVNQDKPFSVSKYHFLQFSASINGLSSLNLFTSVFLVFRRLSTTVPSLLNLSLHLAVHTFSPLGQSLQLISETDGHYNISFEDGSDESSSIHVFYDRLVYRSAYRLLGSIKSDQLESLTSLEVVWKSGDPTIAWISIIVKFCCALVAFSVSLSYLRLMRLYPFSGWSPEQKLTIVTTILCLLNDFPLVGLYLSPRSGWVVVVFSVMIAMFRGNLCFYILMLFDSLSCRYRRRLLTYFIAGLFAGLLALFESWLMVANVIDALHGNLLRNGKPKTPHHFACEVGADLAISVAMVIAFVVKDETEKFRFGVYLLQTILLFGVRWAARYAGRGGKELTDILTSTGENVFVVLAGYLHWPYRYVKDAVYEDPKMQERQNPDVVAIERILEEDVGPDSDAEEPVL